ncbi:cell division protein FtsA [Spiroplasma helicoides]|uniref:Cell division protein FtsA n=1 Tax=Spiroplasma helicoides TaxID=216938 RepID=A0A1B3SL74_9MOLU|nr:hypothetical protein [Spiroplasma helicoides]AOG60667.1 cell division protein FtsA [Spiroplasma helicoides]
MNTEVYAILEITKKEFRFIVGRYRNNLGLKVIFKERFKGQWLNDNDEIIDVNLAKLKLAKVIKQYETTFNEKLNSIGIIYPTKTLKVRSATTIVTTDPETKVFSANNHKYLINQAKLQNENDFDKVVLIRPYEYMIDSKLKKNSVKEGIKATTVAMFSNVYTINKKVAESHNQIILKNNKEILLKNIHTYATAIQCIDSENFRKPTIVVDWGYEYIDMSFYSKETLVKRIMLPFGIENIISNVANCMLAKPAIVESYVFKMLNFKSNKSDDKILYRKYNTQIKKNIVFSAKQIKDIVISEIFNAIKKIDAEIHKEAIKSSKGFKVYYNGKITEIAGFANMLTFSEFGRDSLIYYSKITGANEIWTTAICGLIKLANQFNKTTSKFITSTKHYSKDIGTNNPSNKGFKNTHFGRSIGQNVPPHGFHPSQQQFVPKNVPPFVAQATRSMPMNGRNINQFSQVDMIAQNQRYNNEKNNYNNFDTHNNQFINRSNVAWNQNFINNSNEQMYNINDNRMQQNYQGLNNFNPNGHFIKK